MLLNRFISNLMLPFPLTTIYWSYCRTLLNLWTSHQNLKNTSFFHTYNYYNLSQETIYMFYVPLFSSTHAFNNICS